MDFKPGQHILIHSRTKLGTDIRAAQINSINSGMVTYGPHYGTEHLPSGQGSFDPKAIGTKPYGKFKIEIIGQGQWPPPRPFSPRPGDPGYDSMR